MSPIAGGNLPAQISFLLLSNLGFVSHRSDVSKMSEYSLQSSLARLRTMSLTWIGDYPQQPQLIVEKSSSQWLSSSGVFRLRALRQSTMEGPVLVHQLEFALLISPNAQGRQGSFLKRQLRWADNVTTAPELEDMDNFSRDFSRSSSIAVTGTTFNHHYMLDLSFVHSFPNQHTQGSTPYPG
jgi:hypothetical protein